MLYNTKNSEKITKTKIPLFEKGSLLEFAGSWSTISEKEGEYLKNKLMLGRKIDLRTKELRVHFC